MSEQMTTQEDWLQKIGWKPTEREQRLVTRAELHHARYGLLNGIGIGLILAGIIIAIVFPLPW